MKARFKLDPVSVRKIKISFNNTSNRVIRSMHSQAGKIITKEIKRMTAKGSSPVSGEGKYKKYSDSYKRKIKSGAIRGKSVSPVNLRATGKMMKSLRYEIRNRKLSIVIGSRIAKFHNDIGAGASKVIRKILPNKEGERYANPIMSKLKAAFTAIMRRTR